jgi:hypothetical protein
VEEGYSSTGLAIRTGAKLGFRESATSEAWQVPRTPYVGNSVSEKATKRQWQFPTSADSSPLVNACYRGLLLASK